MLGGYMTIALITLIVGGVGYYGLTRSVADADNISQKIKDRGKFLSQSIDLARSAQVNFKKQVQAWKDLLLRGRDSASFAKYRDEFVKQESLTQANLASLKSLLAASGIDTAMVDDSIRTHAELGAKYRDALKSYDGSKADAAEVVDRLVKGIDRPATDAIDKIVDAVQQFDAETTKAVEARFHSQSTRIKGMTLIGVFAGIGIALALGLYLSRSLSKQIRDLAADLATSSHEVSGAAHQVSTASQSLAEGASEQAASLEETSSSLEEMASMTKRNAENAQKANDLAKQARSAADKGANDMQAMSAAMEAIKASSDDIAKIIKTIDEIAFQTNILALNAAVEAARAGEAGMGFAVVADEVRNLAQRSAQAAKETAGKIEGAITRTAQGVEISGKVAQALNEIVTKARLVDELAAEVAGASREQTQGITQINGAVGQMDKVTQSNAASAEESAAAAEELNAQAATMKQAVTELMQLVGGRNQTPASPVPAPAPKPLRPANVAPTSSAAGCDNGHARMAPVPVQNGRSAIPLEGDFKDF